MALDNFEELQKKVSNITKDETYTKLCKNIKKIRLERYNQFKEHEKNSIVICCHIHGRHWVRPI